MISLEKWYILTPLQQLPMNVGDLGKLVAAKGFKKWSKKLPDLVTLPKSDKWLSFGWGRYLFWHWFAWDSQKFGFLKLDVICDPT